MAFISRGRQGAVLLSRSSASISSVRWASSQSFKLPDLPYDYNALEPVISAQIMEIHHKKHHAAYTTNLNVALEKYAAAEAKNDVAEMIALQSPLKFNGGGFVNHSIFWKNLAPIKLGGGQLPAGELANRINTAFGSLDNFITKFNGIAAGVQGSGWAWLGYNKADDKIVITTCANQDPLSTQGLIPLLGIDVWEHAYYLDYKNARPDYLKNIWKVVNWKDVSERLDVGKKK